MASNNGFCGESESGNWNALDAARAAYQQMLVGPRPVWVDGRTFHDLPQRWLRIDEVGKLLLDRRLPIATVDAVWAHLVQRSRAGGQDACLACVGLALPALLPMAAKLSAAFAGDWDDLPSAVLTGFIAELARVDVDRPHVFLRLRWAAYRGGAAVVREALQAPQPFDDSACSTMLTTPPGHVDVVLARASVAGVITAEEADLIEYTRLEKNNLAGVAAQLGIDYFVLYRRRRKAEQRLAAFLAEQIRDSIAPVVRRSEIRAFDTATIPPAERIPSGSRLRVLRDAESGGVVETGPTSDHGKDLVSPRKNGPEIRCLGVRAGQDDEPATPPTSRRSGGASNSTEVRPCA